MTLGEILSQIKEIEPGAKIASPSVYWEIDRFSKEISQNLDKRAIWAGLGIYVLDQDSQLQETYSIYKPLSNSNR